MYDDVQYTAIQEARQESSSELLERVVSGFGKYWMMDKRERPVVIDKPSDRLQGQAL